MKLNRRVKPHSYFYMEVDSFNRFYSSFPFFLIVIMLLSQTTSALLGCPSSDSPYFSHDEDAFNELAYGTRSQVTHRLHTCAASSTTSTIPATAVISVTVTVTTTTTTTAVIASTLKEDPKSVAHWVPAVVSSTYRGDTSDWFLAVHEFIIWCLAVGWEISRTYWELILEIQGWIQHHPFVAKISAVVLSLWISVQYICSSIVFTVRLLVHLVISLYQVYLLISPYIRWWISFCSTWVYTGLRLYQHYDTHFPEETRQLFTGTSVLFAAVLWFSVGRRRRSKPKESHSHSQQQHQNIFIHIAGGSSYRFSDVGSLASVTDRNLVWAKFVKAMNSSATIQPTEVPVIVEAFKTSATLTKTPQNTGFLKSLMSKAKSLTGYTQLKRAVLTLDVAKDAQATSIQSAVDEVMSMPTAFTSQGLIRVLQRTRDSYYLSLVPEGGKQFILSLINVGPLRRMRKKAPIIEFVKNNPHDDANVLARALLKSFRFQDHKPFLHRIPLSPQLLQQVDSVQGVPKTTMIFSNGKKATAILDCGSVKPFISRNLLDNIDGIISQSVNHPVKKIITTTGSKLVPNEVIRIQFQLPAVNRGQLFVEEFDIVPTDNLLALGAEFLQKVHLNPMSFVDAQASKQQSRVDRLIAKHVTPFLFSEPVSLPPHSAYDYDLKLKDSFDKIRPRPLIKPKNYEEAAFMKKELQDLEAKGFIFKVPPTSSYSVPFVVTNDKKSRLVFDFRQLNDLTVPLPSDLPLISQLLSGLKGKVVSILDLTAAYHHLRMSDRSCRFTTFKSILGFYAFSVLAFGLANAPEVFQRFVSSILAEFSGFVRCYLDDVLIISDSVEEHAMHLEQVLSRLKEHQLHLNQEKSIFFEEKEFKWLGHRFIIDAASGVISIHPADRTIQIIKNFPRPTSKLELQQYLGHINYIGSFIPKLSIICTPFQPLLAKHARFSWSAECEEAFQTLRDLELQIMSKQSFTPGKPITIVVDASDYAVGCALLQENTQGDLVPVEFRSTTLTGFQTRWSTTEKELYALKFAVDKFQYFMSASSEIRVETDHKALSDIFNSSDPTPKQVRWINFIVDGHSVKIDHVPGSTNQLADYLSRYRPASPEETTKPSLDVLSFHQLTQSASELTIDDEFSTRLAAAYQTCPAYSKIISSIGDYPDYHLSNGLLYYEKSRLVIPEVLIEDLLAFYHTSVFGGHAGGNKLHTWLKKHYYFSNMSRVIKVYVAQCVVCQRAKSTNRTFGHLQATTAPSGRWTNISMDVVSGFNDVSFAGSIVNAILVLVDNLSHRCHLFPVNKSLNAQEFSDLMVHRYMTLHGLPQVIHSDLDSTFTSSFTKRVLSAFKIDQQMSVTAHHQSNGIAERKIRTVQEYLRLYIDSENTDWVRFLSYAEFFLNSTPSVVLGDMSPFEVDLGYNPKSVDDFIFPSKQDPGTTVNMDALDLIEELKIIETTAKASINAAHEKSAQFYNRRYVDVEFSVGDQVFVRGDLLRSSGDAKDKQLPVCLRNRFAGPYTITNKLSPVNYEIALPPSSRRSPKFHISQLKRMKKGGKDTPLPPSAPAQVFRTYKDGSEETELKKILGHKKKAKGYLLHVEFVDGFQQWIRMSELKKTATEMVQEYVKSHKDLSGTV